MVYEWPVCADSPFHTFADDESLENGYKGAGIYFTWQLRLEFYLYSVYEFWEGFQCFVIICGEKWFR